MKKKIMLTEEQLKDIILGVVGKESILEYYARVGFFGKNGELEIYIRTDDAGFIPHFHIRDAATQGERLNTCIQISTNKYFLHGGYSDTLNTKQRKALAEFMESSCDEHFENNYEKVVYEWNSNNSSMNVVYNGTIPNYREIE
jgi:hypothetical protein